MLLDLRSLFERITGALDATADGDSLSSSGAVAVDGTLVATQADQAVSSSGAVAIAGALSATQAGQTVSSAGAVAIVGTLPDTSLLTDLVAYWKLDEASGTRVDATGRGNDLTEEGGVVASVADPDGDAVAFDGLGAFLRHADTADLRIGSTDWTFYCEVRMHDLTLNQIIFTKNSADDTVYEYALLWNTVSPIGLWAFDGSGDAVPATTPIGENVWVFVEVQYTLSTSALGIRVGNGTLYTQVVPTMPFQDGPFDVGADFGGLPATADVRRLGKWKRLLTDDERAELYNAGSGTTWPFHVAAQDDNTLAAVGATAIAGTLAATQAAHTLSSAGAVAIAGSLSSTQAGDTLASAGVVSGVETEPQGTGTVFWIDVGRLAQRRAQASATQTDQTLSSSGSVASAGALASTQEDQALASTGIVVLGATLDSTHDGQSLISTGTVPIMGALTSAQDAARLSATGAVAITGRLAATQGAHRLTSVGAVPVIGKLDATPMGDTLAGGGVLDTLLLLLADESEDLVLLGFEPEDEELLLLV